MCICRFSLYVDIFEWAWRRKERALALETPQVCELYTYTHWYIYICIHVFMHVYFLCVYMYIHVRV